MQTKEIVPGPTPNTYWTQEAVDKRIGYLTELATTRGGELLGIREIEVDPITREPVDAGSGGKMAHLLKFELPDNRAAS